MPRPWVRLPEYYRATGGQAVTGAQQLMVALHRKREKLSPRPLAVAPLIVRFAEPGVHVALDGKSYTITYEEAP